MTKPAISVVMPAYNHERYVAEAIESVLNQSFEDLELVIVDDGSTDNTAQVIKGFTDPRVIYHYQENQDAFNSLNNGMALARGDFISIINSDDVYARTRLERMLQAHGDTGVQCVFSDVLLIDDNSAPISDPDFWWIKWHESNRQYYFDYQDLYAAFLHANIMVTTSNLFMTRQAYAAVGNFKPLRYLHDYDYIFRLLNAFPDSVGYLHDEKLISYRLHGSNTLSEAAVVGREQDLMIIRENLLKKCPQSIQDYMNIGIDRLIALEHELVRARVELEAAKAATGSVVQTAVATSRPGLLKRLLARLAQ